jgi:O-antigen ligase
MLSFALALLMVQSGIWATGLPWLLRAVVLGIAVLAALRPVDALLVVAAVLPFGHPLADLLKAHSFSVAEAAVLAFLAGYLWHERRQEPLGVDRDDRLLLPSSLLLLVVFASSIVQFRVVQVWHDYPLRYAESFFRFLTSEYLTTLPDPRPWVDGRGFVSVAALIVESVALLRCTARLCRRDPSLASRLTTVIVAAGVGTAFLSFVEVIQAALLTRQTITAAISSDRWTSAAIRSVDTAGPYFMLVAFLAAATFAAGRWRALAAIATAVSVAALSLTRTRSAIVSGVAATIGAVAWRHAGVFGWLGSRTRALVASIVLALGIALVLIVFNPFQILAPGSFTALHLRVLLAEPALRMLAGAPFVGVGVGQYELRYGEFASPELLRYYSVNNAHNYFLWIGAELGLAGLCAFLWLVVQAMREAWRQAHRPGRLPIFIGLSAFVVTWSIGQPLSVPQVAYTFWISLGMAVAGEKAVRNVGSNPSPWRVPARAALGAAVVLLVASVPIQAGRAVDRIDLTRVSYGLAPWNFTSEGLGFRWTGRQASFFMNASARAIEVPIAAPFLEERKVVTPGGVHVDIEVDGRAADRLVLSDVGWHVVRINAPASDGRFWRVDLRVSPTFVPRTVLPWSSDARELGVAVGELSVVRTEEREHQH